MRRAERRIATQEEAVTTTARGRAAKAPRMRCLLGRDTAVADGGVPHVCCAVSCSIRNPYHLALQ